MIYEDGMWIRGREWMPEVDPCQTDQGTVLVDPLPLVVGTGRPHDVAVVKMPSYIDGSPPAVAHIDLAAIGKKANGVPSMESPLPPLPGVLAVQLENEIEDLGCSG